MSELDDRFAAAAETSKTLPERPDNETGLVVGALGERLGGLGSGSEAIVELGHGSSSRMDGRAHRGTHARSMSDRSISPRRRAGEPGRRALAPGSGGPAARVSPFRARLPSTTRPARRPGTPRTLLITAKLLMSTIPPTPTPSIARGARSAGLPCSDRRRDRPADDQAEDGRGPRHLRVSRPEQEPTGRGPPRDLNSAAFTVPTTRCGSCLVGVGIEGVATGPQPLRRWSRPRHRSGLPATVARAGIEGGAVPPEPEPGDDDQAQGEQDDAIQSREALDAAWVRSDRTDENADGTGDPQHEQDAGVHIPPPMAQAGDEGRAHLRRVRPG